MVRLEIGDRFKCNYSGLLEGAGDSSRHTGDDDDDEHEGDDNADVLRGITSAISHSCELLYKAQMSATEAQLGSP